MRNTFFRWTFAVILSFFLASYAGAAWMLRAEAGFLTVRDLDGGTALWETGIPLSALPEQDRPVLEAGMILHDPAALSKALEDFCS